VLLNLVVGGGALLPFFFRGTKVQSEESAIVVLGLWFVRSCCV
jgi:hypothetical protein